MSTSVHRGTWHPDAAGLAEASLTDEAAFQVQVIALAKRLGYRAYHTHDSRRSEPGFPDLVLVKPPRLLFLELKVGRRQLTDEQRAWLAELDACEQVEAFAVRGRSDRTTDLAALAELLRRSPSRKEPHP